MSGLDPDDLRELRNAFLLDAPQRAARITLRLRELESSSSAAARRAAAAAAAREAHTLEGAARTVALEDLASLAGRLYDALQADGAEPQTLARAIAEEIAAVETAETAAAGAGLTVLHVEDDALNASLVERVLARRPGVRLLNAAHGETALELARERLPDLVLLDLNLPDMSGIEVLRRLRGDPRTADLAVVVVTAHEPARTSQQLGALEIREYLPKPIDVQRLLELVDGLSASVTR